LIPLLRRVQTSTRYLGLKHTYRQQFDVLMRRVLVHVQEQDAPYTTMVRVLALFEAINARRSYFSLLLEYPQVLVRAIQILAASGWAATYLTQNPQLLDTLLQEVDLEAVDYWQQFSITLRERLFAAGGDVELQVDALRHAQHAQTFRILLQDLQGKLSVERVADHLSALADRVIDLTLETVWPLLAGQHLVTPRFAVIAYGRLGGKELGYASDLDLIFLYDDPDENAPQIYTALARKLITWLTSHTGAGLLYDIDTRLRPNGAEGLLVTDLAAFRRYQFRETDNSAWVWEHQALTRARFCAGDSTIGQAFEAIREQVLRQPREVLVLRKEIVAMRERVRKTYAHASDAFDVKHGRGGMVDVEFVVQYLVLLYSKDYPQLMGNVGNIGLLRLAAQAKLIDPVLAENVALAYRTFRAWQHRQRLDGIKQACIADTEGVVERHAVQFLWKKILMESSAV